MKLALFILVISFAAVVAEDVDIENPGGAGHLAHDHRDVEVPVTHIHNTTKPFVFDLVPDQLDFDYLCIGNIDDDKEGPKLLEMGVNLTDAEGNEVMKGDEVRRLGWWWSSSSSSSSSSDDYHNSHHSPSRCSQTWYCHSCKRKWGGWYEKCKYCYSCSGNCYGWEYYECH